MFAFEDLDLLTRLHFVANKQRHQGQWGERRSTRRGEGVEFTDYRDYAPGDELRSVDWNLYARLDRPYVRVFEEEEELAIALLLDGSSSMGWVADSVDRWERVQKLTVALGGIALIHGDILSGGLLQAKETSDMWGPHRGRGYYMPWQKWVSALRPQGDALLEHSLQQYAFQVKRPVIAFILTDGYDREGLRRGTAMLASQGHEVIILHMLTPDELAPGIRGDMRLIDVETVSQREVIIDSDALEIYHQKFEQWCQDLRSLVAKHNGRYVLLRVDLPLRRLLLENMRYANILR